MKTHDSTKKGKAIEHFIISELLKNDFEVFIPVLDIGIDLAIKDKEGGFVEVQVKSRSMNGEDCDFVLKDFIPRENFFIVCHNINDNAFFVMPSVIFHRKATDNRKDNPKRVWYSTIKKYENFKNEKGLDLLKKALENPRNRISGFVFEK
ncbi:MAG: hypothetical protein V1663_02445 [archaeon]